MSETISWNEAITGGKFISFEEGTEKKLLITNWKLEKVEKFGEEQVEFGAEVLEEDGEKVEEKVFTTTSNRLKKKLRVVLENKDSKEEVKISIIKIGEKFDTQYACKQIVD